MSQRNIAFAHEMHELLCGWGAVDPDAVRVNITIRANSLDPLDAVKIECYRDGEDTPCQTETCKLEPVTALLTEAGLLPQNAYGIDLEYDVRGMGTVNYSVLGRLTSEQYAALNAVRPQASLLDSLVPVSQ